MVFRWYSIVFKYSIVFLYSTRMGSDSSVVLNNNPSIITPIDGHLGDK